MAAHSMAALSREELNRLAQQRASAYLQAAAGSERLVKATSIVSIAVPPCFVEGLVLQLAHEFKGLA